MNGNESLQELVEIVAACPEFSGMKLRVSEKKNLNLLNKARDQECIRFPLPTRITTTEMKINCLIQAFLGCLPIHEPSLKQDVLRIMWIGKRVTNALAQYLLQHPHYRALLSAITLAKCFHCKLWENSPHMSRQLRGIGAALSSMLVASNKTSFQSILEANPRDLESILNRPPPIGDNLKAEVKHLPHFELSIETMTNVSVTQLHIYVEMTNRAVIQEHNTAGKNHWLFLLVGDSNNKCIYKERFKDIRLLEGKECWKVDIKDPASVSEVYVNLISEQWVGLDIHSSINLRHPRQTVLNIKNSIAKYLKKQDVDYGSLSLKLPKSQTIKQSKPSIVDQIKDMSEKRLGNNLSITPNRVTLNKFAYTPTKKVKLLPTLEQLKSMGDQYTHSLPQFSNSDQHPTQQVNPHTHTTHMKPKLISDEQVYSSNKPSSQKHTEQDITPTHATNQMEILQQEVSTNLITGLEMQFNQCTVVKCNTDFDQQNTLLLKDNGVCPTARTQHMSSLIVTGESKHEVHNPQDPNSRVDEMKLFQEETCHESDFTPIKPSTSTSFKNCHKPFKDVTLNEDPILEDKHLEREINKHFTSRSTATLNSQLENPGTKKSATVNSQLPNSSNLHIDLLVEKCSSKESKTKELNFQNGKDSDYNNVTMPAPTLSHNAQCNLHKKDLKTDMLVPNTPTSENDLGMQDISIMSSNNAHLEQICSQGEYHRKNDFAIMSDNKPIHSSYSPVKREHTVINMSQNEYSVDTKGRTSVRKRLIFQKTLPKHYYPVFIKSLQSDITGPTEFYSTNCEQSPEPSSETASSLFKKGTATTHGIQPVSGKKPVHSLSDTWAPYFEKSIKRFKELHPLPEEEADFYISVQMKNETSALKFQSSEVEKKISLTNENKLQAHEEESTKNEKVDRDSEPKKNYVVPNFDLVKDLDSFLANMFGDEDNTECKCMKKFNNKCIDNFMANVHTFTTYLARKKSVSNGFSCNSNSELHRIRKTDSNYEPILKLLLKDVSRTEVMPSSSTLKVNEDSETKGLSQQLSSELQFQPKSPTSYINLGAKNKATFSHITQKPLSHDSTTQINQNTKYIFSFSNSAQISHAHDSNQSENCDGKYVQDQFNYQPSVQK